MESSFGFTSWTYMTTKCTLHNNTSLAHIKLLVGLTCNFGLLTPGIAKKLGFSAPQHRLYHHHHHHRWRRRCRLHAAKAQTKEGPLEHVAICFLLGFPGLHAGSSNHRQLDYLLADRGSERRVFVRNSPLSQHLLYHGGLNLFSRSKIRPHGKISEFPLRVLQEAQRDTLMFTRCLRLWLFGHLLMFTRCLRLWLFGHLFRFLSRATRPITHSVTR